MAYEKHIFATAILILAIGHVAPQGNPCLTSELGLVNECFGALVQTIMPLLAQVCNPTSPMCFGFSGAIDCLNAKTLSGICRDSIPGFIDTQLGNLDISGCSFTVSYIYIQCPDATQLAKSGSTRVELSLMCLVASLVLVLRYLV